MRTMVPDTSPSIPGCGIAVMAKHRPQEAPRPGWSPLTFDEAAQCNTAFRATLPTIFAASAQASIAGYMAFGPPASKPFFKRPCRVRSG